MDKRRRERRAVLAALLLLAALGLGHPFPARAADGTVRVRTLTVTSTWRAFARVETITLVRLKALQEGTLTGFRLRPGEQVEAGAVLGRLRGSAAEALLARRRAAADSARADLQAARKILALQQTKAAAHLSTRQTVLRAAATLAGARAQLSAARARLRAAQAALTLRAPASGTILELAAATGEAVTPGQTLLVLQPAGNLGLRGVFYGAAAAALQVGMRGRFAPADGSTAIPVRVVTRIGATPGGGLAVGLTATQAAPPWRSGEAGTLTLKGAQQTLVAVPTRALILSAGRWWVLVRTRKGDQRREVVPGPSRGTDTLIERGLPPGSEVVVENAYLEFHRDFSRHYQPPD